MAHAISVGGLKSFENPLSLTDRVHLFGALAHEMGHAFIFENLTPAELLAVAQHYGGWAPLQNNAHFTLYDRVFFLPHLFKETPSIRAKNNAKKNQKDFMVYQTNNITSEYSTTNIHEWFAEAFAAAALIRMGEAHFFGPNWKELLVKVPNHSTQFWSNYNNLSPDFINWLNARIRKGSHT